MADNNDNNSATIILVTIVIVLIIGLAFWFGMGRRGVDDGNGINVELNTPGANTGGASGGIQY